MIQIFAYILFHSIEWPKCVPEPSPSTMRTWILHYKGIHILSSAWNVAFGKIIVPVMKLEIIIIFILSFFACSRLYQCLDLFVSLFGATCIIASLVMLVPMALVMSSLYAISCTFKQNLFPRIHLTDRKETERILKGELESCGLIRCHVGSLYHMEAKAKLTMIDHVVNGIVFLLVNINVQ